MRVYNIPLMISGRFLMLEQILKVLHLKAEVTIGQRQVLIKVTTKGYLELTETVASLIMG